MDEELTGRVVALEAQVKQLRDVFVKFMNGPYKEQKELVTRMLPLLKLYEEKTGPFVEKTRTRRVPTNRADWEKIMALVGPENNWSVITEKTGIPQSTCRKYAAMTPEEVAELPPGVVTEETEVEE